MSENSAASLYARLLDAQSQSAVLAICEEMVSGHISGSYQQLQALWLGLSNKITIYQLGTNEIAGAAVWNVTDERSRAYRKCG